MKFQNQKRKLQPDVNAGVDCSNNLEIPVALPIDMKKGGPRVSLIALCKKLKLPMPTFETVEQKSRTPFQFGDITGFNSYESEISLPLPDFSVIKLTGEARPDLTKRVHLILLRFECCMSFRDWARSSLVNKKQTFQANLMLIHNWINQVVNYLKLDSENN